MPKGMCALMPPESLFGPTGKVYLACDVLSRRRDAPSWYAIKTADYRSKKGACAAQLEKEAVFYKVS